MSRSLIRALGRWPLPVGVLAAFGHADGRARRRTGEKRRQRAARGETRQREGKGRQSGRAKSRPQESRREG